MAANLHAAGFALVVRDADADRQARFAAEHQAAEHQAPAERPATVPVVAAADPGAFAAADIVVTMLPNGAIVADALLGWGIAAALQPDHGRTPPAGAERAVAQKNIDAARPVAPGPPEPRTTSSSGAMEGCE